MDGNALIDIGENCQIGPFCKFESTNHRGKKDEFLSIIIGRNVWLGVGCIILPGAKIEDNIIIAAGSVVKGNIKGGKIWGGIPAKKIR